MYLLSQHHKYHTHSSLHLWWASTVSVRQETRYPDICQQVKTLKTAQYIEVQAWTGRWKFKRICSRNENSTTKSVSISIGIKRFGHFLDTFYQPAGFSLCSTYHTKINGGLEYHAMRCPHIRESLLLVRERTLTRVEKPARAANKCLESLLSTVTELVVRYLQKLKE